jgi:hypothetical protein
MRFLRFHFSVVSLRYIIIRLLLLVGGIIFLCCVGDTVEECLWVTKTCTIVFSLHDHMTRPRLGVLRVLFRVRSAKVFPDIFHRVTALCGAHASRKGFVYVTNLWSELTTEIAFTCNAWWWQAVKRIKILNSKWLFSSPTLTVMNVNEINKIFCGPHISDPNL